MLSKILLINFILIFSACKRKTSSPSSENSATTESSSFIQFEVDGKKEKVSFGLQDGARIRTSLRYISLSEFKSFENQNLDVLDLREDGSLYSLTGKRFAKECFQVGMSNKIVGQSDVFPLLLTKYESGSLEVTDFPDLFIDQFEYCHKSRTFHGKDGNLASWSEILYSRQLTIEPKDKDLALAGTISRRLRVLAEEAKSRLDAKRGGPPERLNVPSPSIRAARNASELPADHAVKASSQDSKTAAERATNPVAPPSHNPFYVARLDKGDFRFRIVNFRGERQIFLKKKRDLAENFQQARAIGRGASAIVRRLDVDGSSYAYRISTADSPLRAATERINMHFVRELDETYPDAGFMKVYNVSIKDNTISSVSEMFDGTLDSVDLTPRQLKNVTEQLQSQLKLMHDGISIRGVHYRINHSDIKPQNIGIRLGPPVTGTLIDYGESLITIKKDGEPTQMLTAPEGKATREGYVLEEYNRPLERGTIGFLSPALMDVSRDADMEPARALEIQQNADILALNLSIYEAIHGRSYFKSENLTDIFSETKTRIVTPESGPRHLATYEEILAARVDGSDDIGKIQGIDQ